MTFRRAARVCALSVALAGVALSVATEARASKAIAGFGPPVTYRASVNRDGVDANADSHRASISGDGRYVAFESDASDLVLGDSNGIRDIFMRDTVAGTTARVTVDGAGGDPNGRSEQASTSADGRYAAFLSAATDLVPGDDNGYTDIFVRDLVAATTERVGVQTGNPDLETLAPSISADGRYVAFVSAASDLVTGDNNGLPDVFVFDRTTHTTVRASVDISGEDANGPSNSPFMSGNGRYVLFLSTASDLIPGSTDGRVHAFVHDLMVGTNVMVDVAMGGGMPDGPAETRPSINLSGQYVVFVSYATDLVPGDGNAYKDIFRRDLVAGTTTRVSVSRTGGDADLWSRSTSISADGLWVAFRSKATNLVLGDKNHFNDVFLRDMVHERTVRVSVDVNGGDANWSSFNPSLSATTTSIQVAFTSKASDLVSDDHNRTQDIFVRQTT